MSLIHENSFNTILLRKVESLELIDVFDVSGKKTIELSSQSNLTYLIVSSVGDLDIHIVTT